MPRRRHSQVSTSSEQSATSEELLPDVVLSKTSPKDAKDKKRVSFSLAVEPQVNPTNPSTVDLTAAALTPPPVSPWPRRKTKAELKEMVDLTEDDNLQYPLKVPEPVIAKASKKNKVAKKKQTTIKKDAAAEREATKRLKEEEKKEKVDPEEFNKVYKPGESLKHVHIEVCPGDGQQWWYLEDVKRELSTLGVTLEENSSVNRDEMWTTIIWSRDEPKTLQNIGGEVKLSNVRSVYSRKLFVVNDLVTLEQVFDLGQGKSNKATIVLVGAKDLIKKGHMTKGDFTRAVADFLMDCQCELIAVDTSSELALLIARYTRALADAPYKKAKREIDEQAEFYMRGDNKNCVTVDKDGNGLSRLWEQMIATLPMSSLEVARSLGAEYKTPRALAQELQSAGGTTRVAELGVARTNVPGSKTRRLGPEFTRKLHTLLTCEDGNRLVE